MGADAETAPIRIVDAALEKAARELRHRAHLYAAIRDDAHKEAGRAALEQAAIEFALAKLKAALS